MKSNILLTVRALNHSATMTWYYHGVVTIQICLHYSGRWHKYVWSSRPLPPDVYLASTHLFSAVTQTVITELLHNHKWVKVQRSPINLSFIIRCGWGVFVRLCSSLGNNIVLIVTNEFVGWPPALSSIGSSTI